MTDMTNFQDLKEEARRQFQELHSGSKPWIRIGAAVCGEAAGATAVSEAIKDALTKAGIEANVSFVGCIIAVYLQQYKQSGPIAGGFATEKRSACPAQYPARDIQ